MQTYLVLIELNGKKCLKVGHTKYFHPIKRFLAEEYAKDKELNMDRVYKNVKKYLDTQYQIFDNITVLKKIKIEHADPRIARTYARLVEETCKAFFPKNFHLETHFEVPYGTFDGLSGITEMFILEDGQTVEYVEEVFDRIKEKVERLLQE